MRAAFRVCASSFHRSPPGVNAGAAVGASTVMCGESVSRSDGSPSVGAQPVNAGSGWVSNSSSSRAELSMRVLSGGDVIAADESAGGLGGRLTASPSVGAWLNRKRLSRRRSALDRSEVSRICAHLDTEVRAFRDRPTADRTTIPVAIIWTASACVANVKRITSWGTSWSNDSSQSWASALTRQDFNSRMYTELSADIDLVS